MMLKQKRISSKMQSTSPKHLLTAVNLSRQRTILPYHYQFLITMTVKALPSPKATMNYSYTHLTEIVSHNHVLLKLQTVGPIQESKQTLRSNLLHCLTSHCPSVILIQKATPSSFVTLVTSLIHQDKLSRLATITLRLQLLSRRILTATLKTTTSHFVVLIITQLDHTRITEMVIRAFLSMTIKKIVKLKDASLQTFKVSIVEIVLVDKEMLNFQVHLTRF